MRIPAIIEERSLFSTHTSPGVESRKLRAPIITNRAFRYFDIGIGRAVPDGNVHRVRNCTQVESGSNDVIVFIHVVHLLDSSAAEYPQIGTIDEDERITLFGKIETLLLKVPKTGPKPVPGKPIHNRHVNTVNVRGIVEHAFEPAGPEHYFSRTSDEMSGHRPDAETIPGRFDGGTSTRYCEQTTSRQFSAISAMPPES